MTGARYTKLRLADLVGVVPGTGEITDADLENLVKTAQRALEVQPDGYAGPVTVAALRKRYAPPPDPTDLLSFSPDGMLYGPTTVQVQREMFHPTWYGGGIGRPKGIVVHTTDTNPGTALALHRQRQTPLGTDPDIHVGSWHFTIETDGTILQGVPVGRSAWHGGSPSARQLPIGWANYCTVGIELVSPNDRDFPEPQIRAAERLWRALVKTYGIPEGLSMIPHGGFDPERRVDPGREWMGEAPPFTGAMGFTGPAGGHALRVWKYAHGA